MAKFVDSNGCKALANALIGSTKTVNGQSIWGSGNISVSGGGTLVNTLDIELSDSLDLLDIEDLLNPALTRDVLPNKFYQAWKNKNSNKNAQDFYDLLMSGMFMNINGFSAGTNMDLISIWNAVPGDIPNAATIGGNTSFILIGEMFTSYLPNPMEMYKIIVPCTYSYTTPNSAYPFNNHGGWLYSIEVSRLE